MPRTHRIAVIPGDGIGHVGAAVIGSAPSANLNPEREHPSMFEPVHGSAPDIAGTASTREVTQELLAAVRRR